MKLTHLSPNFAVSGQVEPDDLPLLREAGFRAVVNNRPDGEEPDQASSQDLGFAAQRLGLRYTYIPIVPGQMTQEHADSLRRALAEAGGPVLAFCRTGNRSSKLWQLAHQGADSGAGG